MFDIYLTVFTYGSNYFIDLRRNMNRNFTNNPSPNKESRIDNSGIVSDTDSEIENDLPLHPKGFQNHWAAIMKAKDDDELERVSFKFLTILATV